MATPKTDITKILRCLSRCLGHSYGTIRPALSRLGQLRPWPLMLFQPNRDTPDMTAPSTVWRRRLAVIAGRALDFLWICIIFFMSELLIWGLSRIFAPAKLEFFSSICGMVFTFAVMTSVCLWSQTVNEKYLRHLKPKIDFINSHLGIGFPIPLVMLNEGQILKGGDIGRIIGNFVITNLVSWTLVFAISLLVMTMATLPEARRRRPFATTHINTRWPSDWTFQRGRRSSSIAREKSRRSATRTESDFLAEPVPRVSVHELPSEPSYVSPLWDGFVSHFPLIAPFAGIFLVGVPVAAVAHEEHVLDGCVLLFVWVSTTRIQRGFRKCNRLLQPSKAKNALVTLMNPVLMTTLLMTAYVRAKAAGDKTESLSDVLSTFCGGTPLYTLWTAAATSEPLPPGASSWFGAGDAALSILECGMLIWGFKLYECQRQLFSTAGLLTVLVSTLYAAGSVFLSVLSGRLLGLNTPEALSFAARSTTLALAKPAIEAVGGNIGANAALVVSNGILGQLMYPFALRKLCMRAKVDADESGDSESSCQEEGCASKAEALLACGDSPATIAAGIAIGINGAAMGVSYLYETKSRSAPYAALAMTVFGIMTVIFTTVEPFQSVLVGLASR